jgi:hypothetical protein
MPTNLKIVLGLLIFVRKGLQPELDSEFQTTLGYRARQSCLNHPSPKKGKASCLFRAGAVPLQEQSMIVEEKVARRRQLCCKDKSQSASETVSLLGAFDVWLKKFFAMKLQI